jgi:hypothetical protein
MFAFLVHFEDLIKCFLVDAVCHVRQSSGLGGLGGLGLPRCQLRVKGKASDGSWENAQAPPWLWWWSRLAP